MASGKHWMSLIRWALFHLSLREEFHILMPTTRRAIPVESKKAASTRSCPQKASDPILEWSLPIGSSKGFKRSSETSEWVILYILKMLVRGVWTPSSPVAKLNKASVPSQCKFDNSNSTRLGLADAFCGKIRIKFGRFFDPNLMSLIFFQKHIKERF